MTGRASSDSAREQGSNVMQRQFPKIIGAAIALMIGLATLAQAQQTILVMNETRILRESAVGQHIASEIQRINAEMQAELAPLERELTTENEALTAETSTLTEEAIRQRPDLMSRLQALQVDATNYERRQQILVRELQATERAAMAPVMSALQNVLQELVEQRNADLLIDRSAVVYASESIDVTDAAIARLNEVIATTPVNRVRMPQQQAQGAAAPNQ
jgi:Skp family chaperone for outer membrane proteins